MFLDDGFEKNVSGNVFFDRTVEKIYVQEILGYLKNIDTICYSIAKMIYEGYTDKEIQDAMGISPSALRLKKLDITKIVEDLS